MDKIVFEEDKIPVTVRRQRTLAGWLSQTFNTVFQTEKSANIFLIIISLAFFILALTLLKRTFGW
jgi:hypothetical protein